MDTKPEEKMEKLSVEDKPDDVSKEDEEDFVDPWNVASKSDTGIDYDKLIRKLTNPHLEIILFYIFFSSFLKADSEVAVSTMS